jgi:hypothetical protein
MVMGMASVVFVIISVLQRHWHYKLVTLKQALEAADNDLKHRQSASSLAHNQLGWI